ncbi:hypothetical protein PAAG_11503 [Paracoccidioides lutzii Pb01]|uniref:XPG N-terminal domain-containing protein n=1 Tax=Paracoccidioides lutzii (strain ATCC MYA-826 / Pb01) TaxID=502779 RepID=A0A0A2V6P8_PARBA|nr:hypothetical protein PAAG_11503 [Paracoccidioides lutzii Pb01]KGQ01780.1 hypothetical protein PAAG_11503 [Paracoccidioides lutzii Pb01]
MTIRAFDDWASGRAQTLPLALLKGAVIGIDASHYLDQHLNHHATKEPLLIALGGFPFSLKANIEKELQALKNAGITCVFVFNGLDFGKREPDFSTQADSTRALQQAWELYDQQQADQVVDAFSSAGSAKPETLYKFLQRIFHEQRVDFLVAPYAASAQLAYLEKGPNRFVDVVFGSSDLFLFDLDKVITRLDTDLFQITWISRQVCQDDLGRISNDQFIEFCLLLGSRYLRTFPLFENAIFPGKRVSIREAMTTYNSAGRNALALCGQIEDDPRINDPPYVEQFKRALMIVKHHIIMDIDGKVTPMDAENVSNDLHELIGQRLPEELYFYMSKGIIGSQVPDWLTSGELLIKLPLGAEDSEIYRRLQGHLLTPIRTQALCLLANSLHRFYQTKAINICTWYEPKSTRSINLKEDLPLVKASTIPWKIRSDQYPKSVQKLHVDEVPFTFALRAVKDQNFVSKSFAPRDAPILSSKAEILANVMWRFLQLRGYIDEKHQLTQWGQALEIAMSSLNPAENLEETTFIAVELLKLGILSSKDWFVNISGGPMRGTDEEKKFNLLVSQVACIGKIRHKSIGYSGPLSRQLLSFRSLICAVRSSLRDLIEVVLASLLLNGDADRERTDWTDLGLSLPFIDDNNCGLGIAVRTYLDDLPQQPEPTSPRVRAEVKSKGKEWFQHSDSFSGNLDMAFNLWDAVYQATQNAGTEFKDAKFWEETNKWLTERR